MIKDTFLILYYKPILNINTIAGSSLGFIHTDETKKLISEFNKGKNLSEKTKQRLSVLFSGELNPFWGKTHSANTLDKMRKTKLGELNPMFNKEKSQKFIEQMYKDKSGINNPMYGKNHSIDTLEKLRKKVYVYNSNTKELEKVYKGIVVASKDLKISYETLKKYCESNKVYKNKIFKLINSTKATKIITNSIISVVATWYFLHILYMQLTQGTIVSRYPWLTPQYHSDLFQILFNRNNNSLEWCLTSPPKPHAFVSLPLQSNLI